MTQRRRTSGLDRSWQRDKRESLPGTENEDSPCILKLNHLSLYPALKTYITSKKKKNKDLPKSLWNNTIAALKRTKPKPQRVNQKKTSTKCNIYGYICHSRREILRRKQKLCNRGYKAGFKINWEFSQPWQLKQKVPGLSFSFTGAVLFRRISTNVNVILP